jgi:hypothetical protein
VLSPYPVNEAVNPLSIDPNERVTPSGHGHHLNGDSHESLGVTDIGVIPPPPMFSSPSPPPPLPPPPGSQGGGGAMRGHEHQDQHFAKGTGPLLIKILIFIFYYLCVYTSSLFFIIYMSTFLVHPISKASFSSKVANLVRWWTFFDFWNCPDPN